MDLSVNVLVWDKTPVLALGRREVPGAQAARMNTGGLRYRLDAAHPALASHHQKVLVIDDAVAFCGGFDFAANRWDTREHIPGDLRRRLPNGLPYEAHHDVMLAVDGDAARALDDLVRERWRLATSETLAPAPPGECVAGQSGSAFPRCARRSAGPPPAWRERPEFREAEALPQFHRRARDSIYIESQYFASPRIAEAMAAHLAEADGSEIVVINPKRAPSATEQVAMDTARTRMLCNIQKAGRFDWFRLFAAIKGEDEIAVHSKVTVVEDGCCGSGPPT